MPGRLTLWLALVLALPAGADDGFVGSAACATCHASIAASQVETSHRRALRRAGEHPAAQALARLGPVEAPPGFASRFYRAGEDLRLRVSGASELTDMQVDWAFGAGGQGVTLVSHLEDDYYLEHGLSFFGSAGLARTPGHMAQPQSLAEAVGLIYRVEGAKGVRTCFECHTTGALRFDRDGSALVGEPGVGCESCHGPGAQHLSDPARIVSGKGGPKRQIELCGTCHRRPDGAERIDWQDPWNVRHAPVYLVQSRCFQSGELGCTSCHDPHGPLEKADGRRYRTVCLQCHGGAHAAAEAFSDCVACHMPRVRPHEQLRFTNHWIGVYEPDAPLQPARP